MKVDLMLNPVTLALMPAGTHESPAKTLISSDVINLEFLP